MMAPQFFIAAACIFLGQYAASTEDFVFGRLTREHRPADGTYRFVVKYTRSAATHLSDVRLFLMAYDSGRRIIRVSYNYGKMEFTIPITEYEEADVVVLRVTLDDRKYTLPIEYRPGSAKNTTEDIPDMWMEVLPRNDFVTYEDGDDTIITSKVRMDLKNRNLSSSWCDVRLTQLAFSDHVGSYVLASVSSNSENPNPDGDIRVFSDLPEPKRLHSLIMVKTSSGKLDGELSIMHEINFDENEDRVLRYMRIAKSIDLYRSDRDDPFPSGMIGFVVSYVITGDNEVLADKFDYVTCDPEDYSCKISCTVAGSFPRSLKMVRVLSDGSEVVLYPMETQRGSQTRADYVIRNPGPDDAGRYVCVARTPQMEIRRTIHVRYGHSE